MDKNFKRSIRGIFGFKDSLRTRRLNSIQLNSRLTKILGLEIFGTISCIMILLDTGCEA